MKHNILLFLCSLYMLVSLRAQDEFVVSRSINRNVHEQDGHFLITTIDAPFYVYAEAGESFATSDYFPFILLSPDTTAVKDLDALPGMTVFPNPAMDHIVIQRVDEDGELEIGLFTTDGKQILKEKWPPDVTTFQSSIQYLSRGTYILTISNVTQTKGNRYKIIKL